MATIRKKIVRKTKKTAARKSPARRKTTTAKRKIVRRNTASKPIKKNATKKNVGLSWGKDVKAHPVTGKPCAGRPMSQRDQKLFTKMGKRRTGVTPSMVSEVYGKKPAAKKTITRKPATGKPIVRKPTTLKRRKGSPVTVTGLPVRPQKFVVVDGSMRYQSSSRLLTTARKKQAALEAANPRKRYRIVVLEKG